MYLKTALKGSTLEDVISRMGSSAFRLERASLERSFWISTSQRSLDLIIAPSQVRGFIESL